MMWSVENMKIDKSKLNFKMGRWYKLVPLLEKAIANHTDDQWVYKYQDKTPDHHWHPSSHPILPVSTLYEIATLDPEHAVFEPHPNSLLKIFQVGHFWHQWLQYLMVADGLCDQSTVEQYAVKALRTGERYTDREAIYLPYVGVAGSADVSTLTLGDWEGGVDYKTMNARDFKEVEQNRVLSEWLEAKYECQFNLYMDLFDKEWWMLLGVQKEGPHAFTELVYHRNQPLIDWIHDKFLFVNEAIASGTPVTTLDDDHWPEPPLTGPVL